MQLELPGLLFFFLLLPIWLIPICLLGLSTEIASSSQDSFLDTLSGLSTPHQYSCITIVLSQIVMSLLLLPP